MCLCTLATDLRNGSVRRQTPVGPVVPVGPVDPFGTLSPSDSEGPVGPDGTLSSTVFAGMLIPAIPSGLPFPAGPVGKLSRLTLNLLVLWALLARCPRVIM